MGQNNPFAPLIKSKRPLQLCDVIYQKPTKLTQWHDFINFVYRDLVTGEKKLFTIKDPEYEIYLVKPEYRTFRKPRDFMERHKLEEFIIPYKDRYKEIATLATKASGDQRYWDYFKKSRTEMERRMLYLYPYVLGADVNIENYYISKWAHELETDKEKYITSFFLDIEVNLKGWEGDIPREGECPIDAVTLIDGVTKISHTFLYHTPDNPQIDEFITPEKQKEFQEKTKEMFGDDFGDIKEYRCYMFEDEREMLHQLFVLIHTIKRDFGMVWNGLGFDLPYIKGRFEKLGMDPKKEMCHSDFPTPTLILFEDTKAFNFDEKRSFATVSCYTHWIDQQIQYASLRKSQGALKKVSLDFIAQKEEIGKKIDHTNIGNFTVFSYMDYMPYVLYNVKDVLLQWGIDCKVEDMFRFYNQCYNNRSPLKDGLKQTVSLRCLIYDLLKYEYNMVLGHNANFMNYKDESDEEDEDDDSFEGAINADPMLNAPKGLILFGKLSRFLFGDCIDFDFSAMYPNAIVVFNIFKTTMIGKLIIENVDHLLSYDEDAGKEFVEDMIAQDAVHTCHKWLGLPDTLEMTELINQELKIA